MAYCDVSDMEKLLPLKMLINLSNDASGATTVHPDNVAESIDQADREIDAYLLLAGYPVPMYPVPPLVTNLSSKMAIWNLHLRKYFDSEIWSRTYEGCLKLLQRIAEGKLTLGQEVEGEVAPLPGKYAIATRRRKFTAPVMEEFSEISD
jgi:phage gp36-like protein